MIYIYNSLIYCLERMPSFVGIVFKSFSADSIFCSIFVSGYQFYFHLFTSRWRCIPKLKVPQLKVPEVDTRWLSTPLWQYGELEACRTRPQTRGNVRRSPRTLPSEPGSYSVLRGTGRFGRGSVCYPVFCRCFRTRVSALLLSGDEHTPKTRRPAAHVPAQEEDSVTRGVTGRTAQILTEVTQLSWLILFGDVVW